MDRVGDNWGDPVLAARASSDAFREFAQRHLEPLAEALAMITFDRQLAADAAQDAFLRLHLRWESRKELDDPVAWVYRVGINRCHDYRRQIRRAARLFDRLAGSVGAVTDGRPWAPGVEFASLVGQLPRQQRVAAVLFYQADLSVEEVASVMRISEGAVKSHLHRARLALEPLVRAE